MGRSFVLKVSRLLVMVSLCVGMATANAGDVVVREVDHKVWQNWKSPATRDLNSVFMVSADDGWAVGDGRTVVRWNRNRWSNVKIPEAIDHSGVSLNIYSMFMVSADDGWAVGSSDEGSPVIRWNGTEWSYVTLHPTQYLLYSVFMVGADDGWAVGWPGTIVHWNGTDWSNVTSPTTKNLWEVFMVSADDGWAVGEDGTIIRWNGTDWNNTASPTTKYLVSVFMVSADDGWAVGEDGTIIRWTTPIPFWMRWWFWAIVASGVLVSAGAVYFLKMRKPPTQPTIPSSKVT